MKVTPKSDKELSNVYLPGKYDAEIVDAQNTVSKAGNDMIKLQLRVFDGQAGSQFIFDYLLDSIAYKIKHAAQACGLLDKYNARELDASDFLGKGCQVKLKVQEDAEGKYKDKNVISDYVISDKPEVEKTKNKVSDIDDSIPF